MHPRRLHVMLPPYSHKKKHSTAVVLHVMTDLIWNWNDDNPQTDSLTHHGGAEDDGVCRGEVHAQQRLDERADVAGEVEDDDLLRVGMQVDI